MKIKKLEVKSFITAEKQEELKGGQISGPPICAPSKWEPACGGTAFCTSLVC